MKKAYRDIYKYATVWTANIYLVNEIAENRSSVKTLLRSTYFAIILIL